MTSHLVDVLPSPPPLALGCRTWRKRAHFNPNRNNNSLPQSCSDHTCRKLKVNIGPCPRNLQNVILQDVLQLKRKQLMRGVPRWPIIDCSNRGQVEPLSRVRTWIYVKHTFRHLLDVLDFYALCLKMLAVNTPICHSLFVVVNLVIRSSSLPSYIRDLLLLCFRDDHRISKNLGNTPPETSCTVRWSWEISKLLKSNRWQIPSKSI